MQQPLEKYSSQISLLSRKQEPVQSPLSKYSAFSECILVTCMGVLAVTLGIILLIYSSDRVAFSAGVSMTAAGIVFALLSGVLALHKDESPPCSSLEAGRRAESYVYIPEPSVMASTWL